MEYDCDDEYEPIVLRGDESPELREALSEMDDVVRAVSEGDLAQASRMRGIMQRVVLEQERQRQAKDDVVRIVEETQ